MRTNIVLDDELVEEGLRVTGARTKKELVHRALEELVERHRRLGWRELVGRVRLDADFDLDEVRRDRALEPDGSESRGR